MRLLFAEDDPGIAQPVLRAFERSGWAARWTDRGDSADEALASTPGGFDAVVLDIGLPGRDGLDVLRRLRARGDAVPVLLLTARDAVSDRVLGLDAGADDYLVKPFDLVELEARVRALLRRGRAAAPPVLRLGRLSLHPDETAPRLDDRTMELSPREAGVLAVLLRRAGRVVGKARVLQEIATDDPSAMDLSDQAVEVMVHRLRRKLEGSGAEIHTVRGFGYLLRSRDD